MKRLLTLSAMLSLTVGCGLTGDADVAPAPKPGGAEITPGPRPGTVPGDEGTDSDAPLTSDDCEEVEAGSPLAEGEWLTGSLSCGDEIVGHTGGGANLLNTRFYEANQCTPATTSHDGGNERIYQITVPKGDRTVEIDLTSPCGDLDLAAFVWSGDKPPSNSSAIYRCEMNQKTGTKSENVRLSSQKETTWTVVVEGKKGEALPYALQVSCRDGLQ